ncbi:MAG: hypothetical protein ABIJ34_05760 [archaeon]
MRKVIFALIFLITIFSATSFMGHIYTEDMKPGKTGEVIITFYNPTPYKEDGLQVITYIPDLGTYYKQEGFTLRRQTAGTAYMFFDIPKNTDVGYYPVIVSLENDDGIREKDHTWIYIG